MPSVAHFSPFVPGPASCKETDRLTCVFAVLLFTETPSTAPKSRTGMDKSSPFAAAATLSTLVPSRLASPILLTQQTLILPVVLASWLKLQELNAGIFYGHR